MIMTRNPKNFALTAHITCSVGLLGAIGAFSVLAIAGLTAQDLQIIRAAYLAMPLIAQVIIVPLASASLLTGMILSLSTSWGLLRHYWVLAKFLLTTFATVVLLAKMELITYAADLAEEAIPPGAELRAVGLELLVHSAGGLLVLLVPVALSVYKPRGLTSFGRRKQQERRGFPAVEERPEPTSNVGTGVAPKSGSVCVSLRYSHLYGCAVAALVLHLIILHLIGIG